MNQSSLRLLQQHSLTQEKQDLPVYTPIHHLDRFYNVEDLTYLLYHCNLLGLAHWFKIVFNKYLNG